MANSAQRERLAHARPTEAIGKETEIDHMAPNSPMGTGHETKRPCAKDKQVIGALYRRESLASTGERRQATARANQDAREPRTQSNSKREKDEATGNLGGNHKNTTRLEGYVD